MNQNLSEAAMNWGSQIQNMNWQCNGSKCKKENAKTHPDEEVDHEEDVEGEVDLLGGVLHPRGACFHTIPESGD